MKSRIYKAEMISKSLAIALRSEDFYWNQWSWDNFLQLNAKTFEKIKAESYGSYSWAFDFRHGGVFKINDNLSDNVVRVKSFSTLKIKLVSTDVRCSLCGQVNVEADFGIFAEIGSGV